MANPNLHLLYDSSRIKTSNLDDNRFVVFHMYCFKENIRGKNEYLCSNCYF